MHTFGLLQGLLAYPLTQWVGVLGAFNIVLVGMLFLNGLFMYALFPFSESLIYPEFWQASLKETT